VRLPFGPGRHDLVPGAEPESEPAVVGGIAEQGHQGFAERVGRAEYGVHEGASDAAALAVRTDAQRAEPEHGYRPDVPAGAQHVPGYLIGIRGGHQRQRGQPRRASPELVDQDGLRRGVAFLPGAGERGGRDGADDVDVARRLASYEHGSRWTVTGPPRN
jgi:hypothetical protein